MSPVTHFLTGWVVANAAGLNRRERALVTAAAVVPDLDGLGVVVELATRHSSHPLLWFSRYHHALHNLPFAVVVAVACAIFATRRVLSGTLAFGAFHIHLLEDVLGSRGPEGYSWPIQYLAPFSSRLQLAWSGQWALNAWPNVVITIALLGFALYIAWKEERSPVEFVSVRADSAIVSALRTRFPHHPRVA